MNCQPKPDDKQYIKLLYQTYNELRDELKLDHKKECEQSNLLPHNVKRDEKKERNPYLITFRNKCLAIGISFPELIRVTDEKFKAWQQQKEEAGRQARLNALSGK